MREREKRIQFPIPAILKPHLAQLKSFAEDHDCEYRENLHIKRQTHKFHFFAGIFSKDKTWRAVGIGEYDDRGIAIALGLRSLVKNLLQHYKTSFNEWSFLSSILYASRAYLRKKFWDMKAEQRKQQIRHTVHLSKKAALSKPKKPKEKEKTLAISKEPPTIPDSVIFDGLAHTLFICKSERNCRKKGHAIYPVTGILASVRGTPIKINVNYCANCRMYFIGYQEYQHYIDFYGPMLGKIAVFVQEGRDSDTQGFQALAKESILKICGYSVRQGELEERERRCILANIMDRKIASKGRVMEYLHFFINNHYSQPTWAHAVSKWRDDLDWVRNYHIDTQRRFLIAGVRHA